MRRLLFVLASSKFNETHFQRHLTTCQAQMDQGRIIYQREGCFHQTTIKTTVCFRDYVCQETFTFHDIAYCLFAIAAITFNSSDMER